MSDANRFTRWIMRQLVKLSWSVGARPDEYPRMLGSEMERTVMRLQPGDLVLMGNGGSLSHVGLYLGDGEIVHSMATDQTGRGVIGSAQDALTRPFHGLTGYTEKTGVLRERLSTFFDRFERDAYAVLRRASLDSGQIDAGLDAVIALIGKPYDYDFNPEDDEYYCSELVVRFLNAAEGRCPEFETVPVEVPGLLRSRAIEPVAFLTSGHFTTVLANQAARDTHKEWLANASPPE